MSVASITSSSDTPVYACRMTERCKLCESDGRVPPLAWLVEGHQFLLERLIEQGMPMIAQEHKQFSSPYLLDNLFFLPRKCDRWMPMERLHLFSPCFSAFPDGRLSDHRAERVHFPGVELRLLSPAAK